MTSTHETFNTLVRSPATASPARVSDYLLGGKDNYAADRDLVDELLRVLPHLDTAAREGRAFLYRAVGTLARRGIRQFLDIGCGLPGGENVHRIASGQDPGCRVVYVDHDPIVLAHARALLAACGDVAAVHADLRDPAGLLAGVDACGLIDRDRPVAVLLTSVLHFLTAADRPYEAVAELRAALAPGSALVISHATADFAPETLAEAARIYSAGCSAPLVLRDRAGIMPFFGDLTPAGPGLAPLSLWRPNGGAWPPGPSLMYAGIGLQKQHSPH
ncbi:SAM-dependent methyltransferase [Actinomadura sp. 9N407]|uniref:SAM-dependent methyltransferase n=1 Tax=Actinomadura sp. 9N407 TaxID=3375154 RepID=UPI0037941625